MLASNMAPSQAFLGCSKGPFRRDTHVQFWEGVGVNFPALLDCVLNQDNEKALDRQNKMPKIKENRFPVITIIF